MAMAMQFEDYEAGRFVNDANTLLGREIFDFLASDASVDAMEVASDLGSPAVAGIEEKLLGKFGEKVLPDRIKQMIGHMVRKIMEDEGFVVDQSDVKMGSVPFSKGTRYKRPEWFPLHVFYSTTDPRQLCFTQSRAGDKLPPEPKGGKWRYRTTFSTTLRGVVAFGISPTVVRDEVKAKGYAMHRQERVLRPA
jgi:hypothetical protein